MSIKVKLTKRAIDGLAPAEKAYKAHDADLPGLSLRVYPNGRKAFFYRYRVGVAVPLKYASRVLVTSAR